MTGSPRRALVLLLAVVALYRFSLLDRGATAFVDETLYFTSVMALQAVADGDVPAALAHLAAARGRQGAAVVQLPLAAIQAIPAAFGVPASNLRSLRVPTVFNVLVSLGILWLFVDLAHRATGHPWAALSAGLLYALLVNTNLYLRHVLPYDWALALGVAALALVVHQPASSWRMAGAGLLAGAMVTFYTGYYLMVPVIGLSGAAAGATGLRAFLRRVVWFGGGATAALALVEAVCRLGGVSYLASSRALSRTITHGDFGEGWSFVPEYLLRVERLSGTLLLVALSYAVARAARALVRRRTTWLDWLIIWTVVAWVWQSYDSAVRQHIVVYGRLLHGWFFVLGLALAAALAALGTGVRFRLAATAVAMGTLATWLPAATAFARLAYPPDVLYALGIDSTRIPPPQWSCDFTEGTAYASPAPLVRETRWPYTDDDRYLLVNFCQGPPSLPRPPRIVPPGDARLAFDGPHWLSFPAYTFEGMPPSARAAMRSDAYRLQVYRLAGDGRSPTVTDQPAR